MTALLASVALAFAPIMDAVDGLGRALIKAKAPLTRPKPPDPPMSVAVASWYSYPPGASTACGFDGPLGVANKTLACGTRVRFCARLCATGTVDDRGPFVAGRTWDLSLPLADAIGFNLSAGVASVRWAIVK